MRLPREVEAILRATTCCPRACTVALIDAGLEALRSWCLENGYFTVDAGDVALSLLMSEAAGGEL